MAEAPAAGAGAANALGPPVPLPAAAGAGAAAPAAVLDAAEGIPWYSRILEKLGYFASLPMTYGRMAISRITAAPSRPTLEELAELTQQTSYRPPGWLSTLINTDPGSTMAKNAILSGARAHAAAFKVLRSYIIFRNYYDKNSPELGRQVEILFKDVLIYNVYTYYKYKNRAGLLELAQARRNIPIAKFAEESQSFAVEEGIVENKPVILETMPYELADALNAVVRMYPAVAIRYGLEAGSGAGPSAKPPHIVGIPNIEDVGEAEFDGAMEPHIQVAEAILMNLEDLWKGVNGGKPVNREQLLDKLGIVSKPGDPKDLLDIIAFGMSEEGAGAPPSAVGVGAKRGRSINANAPPGPSKKGTGQAGGRRITRRKKRTIRKTIRKRIQKKSRSSRRS
jgi:hypothetical protein